MRAVAALLVLACLAAATAPSSALQCYACRMSKAISTLKLSPDITNRLRDFPTCDIMAKEGTSDKFKQTCGASDRGCANIVDPEDESNRVRTCFPLAMDKCKGSACYCTADLCNGLGNGAGQAWASAAVMATGLLALLMMVC